MAPFPCGPILPICGLIPFLIQFGVQGSAFGAIVVLNGVMYHGVFPQNPIVCWWDTACNVVMCVAVNAMRWETVTFVPTFVLTLVAAVTFVGLASVKNLESVTHYSWHLLFIQLPLAFALGLDRPPWKDVATNWTIRIP